VKFSGPLNLYPNEISWEDPNDLIPNEIKKRIGKMKSKQWKRSFEYFLESSLRATSDGLFDCIVNWKPIPPEANAFVKEIMVPMSEDISVDKEGNFNGTPLMFAAYFDSNKAVTKLIERGWKTDTANKNGRTALHYSAMNELSCRILLQKGANIDAKDEDGKTPLILAAYRGRLNVVKLLLRSDADTQNYRQLWEDRITACAAKLL
jgi:hypothetical protein